MTGVDLPSGHAGIRCVDIREYADCGLDEFLEIKGTVGYAAA